MRIGWLNNVDVSLQLGTWFFVFLTVVVILLFLWRRVGTAGLSEGRAVAEGQCEHCRKGEGERQTWQGHPGSPP